MAPPSEAPTEVTGRLISSGDEETTETPGTLPETAGTIITITTTAAAAAAATATITVLVIVVTAIANVNVKPP